MEKIRKDTRPRRMELPQLRTSLATRSWFASDFRVVSRHIARRWVMRESSQRSWTSKAPLSRLSTSILPDSCSTNGALVSRLLILYCEQR